jgi:dTDP-glucose 4,6-dehydratase
MKKALITGGAGFIGSNFIGYLQREIPDVFIVNLDALTYAGSMENLRDLPDPARHTFVQGDICDPELIGHLLQTYRIDTIVHFAAETHVDRSLRNPLEFVRTNILGTATLLECARRYWTPEGQDLPPDVRFHHVSTDEVFGSLAPADPPANEQTTYSPSSPYAASKAGSDFLARSYFRTYGLPVTISLCANNYGPRQFPEKIIPLAVFRALEGKTIPVYGDGSHVRDWLHVEDHCRAIRLILQDGIPGETYNVGAGRQIRNLDLVRRICDILDELNPASAGRRSLIAFTRDRRGHDRRYALDAGKLRRLTDWEPRVDLETGLRDTICWYLDHRDWAASIRRGEPYQQWMDLQYSPEEGNP